MSAELIFDRLAFAALQGCVAVALAWIVLRLARPLLPPSVRAAAWTIVFSCLLVGLAGSIPLHVLPAQPVSSSAPLAVAEDGLIRMALIESAPAFSWMLAAVGLWLVVAASLLGMTAFRHHRLRRVLKEMDFAPLAVQAQARFVARNLGLRSCPEIRIDPRPQVPFVAGLRNPCLVLPSRLADEDRREACEAALSHELAHLRRGDLYVEFLAALCRCIFFFNPLVWVAAREWAAEREMACDELVLRRGTVCAKRYCQMLIDFAACRAESSSLVVAVTNGFRHLHRRINQMTNVKKRRRGAAYVYSIAALGIITLGAAPLALKPAPSSEGTVDEATIEQSKIDVITPEAIAQIDLFDEDGNRVDSADVLTEYSTAEIEVFDDAGKGSSLGTFKDVKVKETADGTVVSAVQAVEAAPAALAAQAGSTAPAAAPMVPPSGYVPVEGTLAPAPAAVGGGSSAAVPSTAPSAYAGSSSAPAAPAAVPSAAGGSAPVLGPVGKPSAPVPSSVSVDVEVALKEKMDVELEGAAFDQVIRSVCKTVNINCAVKGKIDSTITMKLVNAEVRSVLDTMAELADFSWSVDKKNNLIIIRPK